MTTSNYPDNPTVASMGGDAGSTSADAGHSAGTDTGSGAKEQAKQAAGTAADQGKQVAGVAQGEARKVASEASAQVRGLVDQTTSQLEDQGRTQRDRLVETLRSFGDDLEKMASQGDSGLASNLAREVADRSHSLSSQLDGREPRELLDDVRSFAQRKPGLFLGGALVAGVLAGRLARGAKDAQSSQGGSASPYQGGSAAPYDSSLQSHGTGAPVSGVRLPEDEVAYPTTTVEGRR